MQTEIIISGFGGQGALFAGQILAYTAMDEGYHVTWIPSYGPEMRGGTANCTVIISDDDIGSPLVRNPKVAIAMNLPSLDKYESMVAVGGALILNASLINRSANRRDIRVVNIPANTIADELGNMRLANLVLVGAMLSVTGVLTVASLEKALEVHLPQRHLKWLDSNRQALRRGAAAAQT